MHVATEAPAVAAAEMFPVLNSGAKMPSLPCERPAGMLSEEVVIFDDRKLDFTLPQKLSE